MSSEQTEITERYIQEIQWSDRATEHEKALVAGNIRQFAHGVMRPLIAVKKHEKKMLRDERDAALADLAALREQLAAEEAGRQADADAARAQREADLQELARMRCRARHAEKELAAKDATIADQSAEIERLREVVAELEAVVGKMLKLADGQPAIAGTAVYVLRDLDEDTAVELDTLVIGPEVFDAYGLDRCYSTREAALAAAEAKPITSKDATP